MRPSLSVILPVYNAAPYLSDCIESILPQLWSGCRLILVDDESDDGSEKVCVDYARQFGDKVVTIRIKHGGLSAARNKALDIVDTDYLAFCDADDLYVAGALSGMADILEKDDRCNIVVAQFSRKPDIMPAGHLDYTRIPGAEALNRTLYQNKYYHNSACAKVYRSKVFDSIRFADGKYYEDLEILARLYLASSDIAICKSVVYYYRPNPTSFINTWSDKRLDAIYAAKSALAYVSKHCPGCIPAAQSRLFSASFNIFNLAVKHKLPAQADECWMIIKSLRRRMLRDPNVRIKNKVAAALSYLGIKICSLIAGADKKS